MPSMRSDTRLRVARAERRINQFDTAEAVGMGRDRYWRIENGYTEPTEEERAKLAAFFGRPVHDLFPTPDAAAPAGQ